jgi:signal transduction histidine kinase
MIKNIEWSSENKLIAGGFSIALCLTSFASMISYQNNIELMESAARVERAQKILNSLTDIMTTLLDAESGRRGYLLFEDPVELQRYQVASKTINPNINRLQHWFYTSSQHQNLTNLKSLITQRLALSERSIYLYEKDSNATEEQANLLIEHKKNRYKIRHVVTEIETDERRLLQQSILQYQLNTQYRSTIEILSTFISFIIIFAMFALVYQQMTKRQQAESCQRILAQEKELSELKLRFFSMVSHEFRTPLSIILGSAQLLTDDDRQWTQEQKLTNLERIQSSARSMNQLLTDILTLTRAEAGKLEFNATLIDIETFCINLIEDIKLCCKPNQILKFTSESYCPHARLDEKLLYSILSNLLSNAVKYSSESGTIEFILICESDASIFKVKDQGIGIPLEDRANLYEPFSRANNVDAIAGTGLGLAVVKKCVDLHRGEIFIDSKVGEGTTFTIKIPQ